MDILVTGGAGFIGSNLARRLLSDGHSVRVVDDVSTGRFENLEGLAVEFIEGSITDPELMRAAVEGAEVVFHQAALPSVPRSVEFPLRSNDVNVVGTLTTLVAANEARVRKFVYAASSSAYGNTPELPKREDMTPRPLSPYAAAKLAGESYCRAFWSTFGLATVSLRYFNVFGPRQDPNSGYAAVVPAFISAVLRGESPTINGDGEQTRDFTFIDNVVEANLLAASADERSFGESINVACGERISVNQLFELIRDAAGADLGAVHAPARAGDVRDSLADISKARELLGYRPLIDHREGLGRTLEWYSKAVGTL